MCLHAYSDDRLFTDNNKKPFYFVFSLDFSETREIESDEEKEKERKKARERDSDIDKEII